MATTAGKRLMKGRVNMTKAEIAATWSRQLQRKILPDGLIEGQQAVRQGPPKATAGTGGFGATKKGKKKRK